MNIGKSNLIASIVATLTGMSLNDIAQLIAFIVAIISGLMAIRHYWTSTRLTRLKIQWVKEKLHEPETKNPH